MPSTMSKAFQRVVDAEVRRQWRDHERRLWQEAQLFKYGWSAIGRKPGPLWEKELDERLPLLD